MRLLIFVALSVVGCMASNSVKMFVCLQVLTAFVQLVAVYAQQSEQLWRGQGQHTAADHTDMQDPTASEHRLSLACQLLSNIIQSK